MKRFGAGVVATAFVVFAIATQARAISLATSFKAPLTTPYVACGSETSTTDCTSGSMELDSPWTFSAGTIEIDDDEVSLRLDNIQLRDGVDCDTEMGSTACGCWDSNSGNCGTPGAAIRCEGNCDVFGGGSVTGGAWGIQGVGRVRVYDTLVFDTGRNGIDGGPATRLFNVVITGAGKEAVWGWRQVIRNSTISGNGNGSVPPSPTVHGDRVAVFDSIITGNEGIGVEGVSARVRDSNVSGNGTSPVCGVTYNCIFDIGSYRRPRVRDTTCDRSLDSRACGECNGEQPLQEINDARLHNWGVCTLD